MALNCDPPYSYRPNFIPGNQPCAIPIFTEKRARLKAGGTFFRSKGAGLDKNNIQLSLIESPTDTFILNVYKDGTLVESFGPYTQIPNSSTPGECSTSIFPSLRYDINLNSNYIEMPTLDEGASEIQGSNTWNASTDESTCATAFTLTNLSGGDGGPANINDMSPPPRTGPQRSLIAFDMSEIVNDNHTDNGLLINPPQDKKIKQWDGNNWIPYDSSKICVNV